MTQPRAAAGAIALTTWAAIRATQATSRKAAIGTAETIQWRAEQLLQLCASTWLNLTQGWPYADHPTWSRRGTTAQKESRLGRLILDTLRNVAQQLLAVDGLAAAMASTKLLATGRPPRQFRSRPEQLRQLPEARGGRAKISFW
jgi:hypothetical protein